MARRERPTTGSTFPWLAVLLVLGAVSLAYFLPDDTPRRLNHRVRGHLRTEPTVVMVVMETTRADRVSACGYGRPTTLEMEDLVGKGGSLQCGAYTPATWTTPALASLFTGLHVPEHGTDTLRRWTPMGEEVRPLVRPLESEFTTLAEHFVEAGYQTALVSENPQVNAASGLQQGFVYTKVAPRFAGSAGSIANESVASLVREDLDPARPLFLTVVLSATREPLSGVSSTVGWAPRTSPLGCYGRVSPLCRDLLAGRLTPSAAQAAWERLDDLYDYAVSRNDAHLGLVLERLAEWGWLSSPWRLVVTSTSGLRLGEDGEYGQGEVVSEVVARVPLLYSSSIGAPPLAAGLSTVNAFSLLRTGRLPEVEPPVMSFANRVGPERLGATALAGTGRSAARWQGDTKIVWRPEGYTAIDLAADPGESFPAAVEADPALAAAVEPWLEKVGRGPTSTPDP